MKNSFSVASINSRNRLKRIEGREYPLSTRTPLSTFLGSPKHKPDTDIFREHIMSTSHMKSSSKVIELDQESPKENEITPSSTFPTVLSSKSSKIHPQLKLAKLMNQSSRLSTHYDTSTNTYLKTEIPTSQSFKGKPLVRLTTTHHNETFQNDSSHNPSQSVHNFGEIQSIHQTHEPNLMETYKFLESLDHRRSTSEVLLSAGLLYKNKQTNSSHKKAELMRQKTLCSSPNYTQIYSPIPDTYCLSLQCVEFLVKELEKPGNERDIETMYALTKHLKFFIQYKADIVKQMLRVGKYEFYNKGQMIFREGDVGRCLYVVLRGSIAVQQEPNRNGELPFIVNSRYDGEVIGEYAIVRGNINTANDKRTASCLAGETCHLIKITADDYMQAVRANIDIESKILNFLCSLGPFEHIPPIDLALLANTLNKESYGLDQVVLPANTVPRGMFIVYQGRVKITYPAKIAQYSQSRNKIWYKMSMKEFQLPRGSFFGQRVLAGDRTPARYSVVSASAQTSILAITPHEFSLLFTFKDETVKYLMSSPQFDLNVPYSFS
ncbi:unnamed protein product [Blepharisma stoltei]|uniref:Cyclic nucleotide-binding domain-containing protein n=1 Tax=Blepharisma stoltei TaxID=1481888 RepID=A0AAU9K0Y8_9CILI|nr:unnamed protein product [Blepharisma stoltei]